MPLKQLKRFKDYSKDWRGNYSVTIQMLMDNYEYLQYLIGDIDNEEEEFEKNENKESDEIPTLG